MRDQDRHQIQRVQDHVGSRVTGSKNIMETMKGHLIILDLVHPEQNGFMPYQLTRLNLRRLWNNASPLPPLTWLAQHGPAGAGKTVLRLRAQGAFYLVSSALPPLLLCGIGLLRPPGSPPLVAPDQGNSPIGPSGARGLDPLRLPSAGLRAQDGSHRRRSLAVHPSIDRSLGASTFSSRLRRSHKRLRGSFGLSWLPRPASNTQAALIMI
ncbi:hypothetical protein NDU88_006974 [Pleurodeles waltl]|uniref:Uncharacterized protein n=1 Tax=Pleurodeles waltl TaxID=8319 RepID=A0AAV7TZ47_PLEWA|nr:hypothetical protein NDU88_006974 [Pleurodeles waltl]